MVKTKKSFFAGFLLKIVREFRKNAPVCVPFNGYKWLKQKCFRADAFKCIS